MEVMTYYLVVHTGPGEEEEVVAAVLVRVVVVVREVTMVTYYSNEEEEYTGLNRFHWYIRLHFSHKATF